VGSRARSSIHLRPIESILTKTMIFELYEVWAEEDGLETLVDTTQSLKEAREIAQESIDNGSEYVIIYREVDGELEVVEEL